MRRYFLPGLGLLLCGVAIGVLVAQFMYRPLPSPVQQEGRVVQSIQVGNPGYEVPMPVVDAYSINEVFKQVARQVTPSVVSITAVMNRRRGNRSRDFEQDLFDRFQPDQGRSSAGSGVLVSEDGYIVTNDHVVRGADAVHVLLHDKRRYKAELVGSDPTTDLAVLRVESEEAFPSVVLGDSDEIEVGEWVVAIGNPFHLNSTVTQGIVSALSRQVNIIDTDLPIEDFIQTDAAINPGNSGGALVDLQGRLIGINTAIATERGSYEGYGFAVPVNLVTQVVNDLIAFGRVRRGLLGIQMEPVTAENREVLGLDEISGVLIAQVAAGGPAERAGLQEGDVIVGVNGRAVNATNQLQSRVALNRPGEVIEIDVLRRGEPLDFQVQLIDRDDKAMQQWLYPNLSGQELQEELQEDLFDPEAPAESPFHELNTWGIVLRELRADDAAAFGLDDGVYVAYVRSESPAHEDGLPRDVVVTLIDGEPVETLDQALDRLDAAVDEGRTSVLFGVTRRDGIQAFYEVNVPLGD